MSTSASGDGEGDGGGAGLPTTGGAAAAAAASAVARMLLVADRDAEEADDARGGSLAAVGTETGARVVGGEAPHAGCEERGRPPDAAATLDGLVWL